MRTYVITLVGAVLSASAICGIFPKEEEGKWVRLAAGLAVACVVFTPLLSIHSLPEIDFTPQELTVQPNSYLMDTFEKTLAEKIAQHLLAQTGQEISVTVLAQMDKNGEITGVSEVRLFPYTENYAKLTASLLQIDLSRVVEA